jgi:hypothetical protein
MTAKKPNGKPKKTPAMMRKVFLPILNNNGEQAPDWAIEEMREERAITELGKPLPDDLERRARERENYLDFRATLLHVADLPKDPSKGMKYSEMKQMAPIIDKLEEADGEDFVLFSEAEYNMIVERLEGHNFPRGRHIRRFIQAVIDSEKVEVEEKGDSTETANTEE